VWKEKGHRMTRETNGRTMEEGRHEDLQAEKVSIREESNADETGNIQEDSHSPDDVDYVYE